MALEKTIKDRFRAFLPVVVDVETAGFDPKQDALLEIAMMTVRMDEQGLLFPDELFSANLRPFEGSNINENNIKFLQIDPFDESRNLQDEAEAVLPMFKAISKRIKAEGCKRAILVGHNGHFDLSFVNALAERIGSKKSPFHPFSVLDTASLSGLVYGQTVLAKACICANLDFDAQAAHGAAYDTKMECQLFCALYNRYTIFAGFPEKYPEPVSEEPEHKEDHGFANRIHFAEDFKLN
ncbi:MAG: ribonuclease T [Succinivibrio sp.]|nr:ribonuclease T [Succinivibrio sp.]